MGNIDELMCFQSSNWGKWVNQAGEGVPRIATAVWRCNALWGILGGPRGIRPHDGRSATHGCGRPVWLQARCLRAREDARGVLGALERVRLVPPSRQEKTRQVAGWGRAIHGPPGGLELQAVEFGPGQGANGHYLRPDLLWDVLFR